MSNADPTVAANPSTETTKPSGFKGVRCVLWTVGILAGGCGVLAIIGMVLPADYSVERSIVVNATPQEMHSEVVSLKTWQKWNTEGEGREYKIPGQSAGEGAVQTWTEPNQPDGKMTITWDNRNEGMQYTVLLDGAEHPIQGTIRYAPEKEGTRITWRVRGKIGNNPIDRWRGLWIERKLGPEFETGLENLKPIVEKQAAEYRKRAAEIAKKAGKAPPGGGMPRAGGPGGGRGKFGGRGKTGGRGKFGGGAKKRPPIDGGEKTQAKKDATKTPEPREDN